MKWYRLFSAVLLLTVLLGSVWQALPVAAGNWVVITLEQLPQHVRAGEALELVIVVRQHGQHPIHVDGQLIATHQSSGESIRFPAKRLKQPGHHQITATFPKAGVWNWYFEPSPFPANGEFAPLTVLPNEEEFSGWWHWLQRYLKEMRPTAVQKMSQAEYGRHLFLAKGCASCHLHSEARLEWSTEIGANLTNYEPNSEFLEVWLRDAWELTANKQWRMPTLELTDEEIEALVAFLAE